MKASFTCGVCKEKITLTGTPDGIERGRVMWLKGHEHPIAVLTTGSTVTAAPVELPGLWDDSGAAAGEP